MSDTIAEVTGIRRESEDALHIVNPLTGRSACGVIGKRNHEAVLYDLTRGEPTDYSLCEECDDSEAFMIDLPPTLRGRYREVINRLRLTMSDSEDNKPSTEQFDVTNEQIDQAKDLIDVAVPDHAAPVFYSVSGSHTYGHPSEGSDVDVRGFHVTPRSLYTHLDQPNEQIVVNQDGITDGFEDYEDIDFVSYELRKYGTLIYKNNPNVLEALFGGQTIKNRYPDDITNLKQMIEEQLPMDVPYHYYGMGKGNFERFLNVPETSAKYTPNAKKYLYVIRGLLGAIYVDENHMIEPRVRVLSNAILDGSDLVDDLIQWKLEHGEERLPPQLEDDAYDLCQDLIDKCDYESDDDKDIKSEINQWMMSVRLSTEQ